MSITSPKSKRNKKPDKVSVIFLFDKGLNNIPTPLLQFGLNNMIDIHIASANSSTKNTELVFCVGYEANKVCNYVKYKYPGHNIRIIENVRYEETNYCESLRLCLNSINNDSIIVCNGNIVTYPEMFMIPTFDPYILLQNSNFHNLEVGAAVDENNVVTNMGYGLPNLWSEIFFLHGLNNIETLRRIVSSESFENKFIFEAINELSKVITFTTLSLPDNHHTIKVNSNKLYNKVKNKYENFNSQLFIREFD
jgi:hypothetical protein